MVIAAQVVFVVDLARVAFVAYCAVEESDGVGDGVVSWWHGGSCVVGCRDEVGVLKS